MNRKEFLRAAVAAATYSLAGRVLAGAADPAKSLRIVVGFAAGGATDMVARMLAQKLGEMYGQPVIVENKVGAGTNIAVDYVSRAAPDGYTLFMGGISNAINASLYSNLSFDFPVDFVPLSILAGSNVLVVHPSVAANTVPEFIALAKAKPGELTFASSGSGSSIHMSGELFKMVAGIDMAHVPYKGSAPALTALVGGHVHAMFDSVMTSAPHIKAGTLKALAVTTAARSANLPDVPTFAEAGIPDFVVEPWQAIFVSSKAPSDVVQKLSDDIYTVCTSADVREKLNAAGYEALKRTPREMRDFLTAEASRWGQVVKATGAKVG